MPFASRRRKSFAQSIARIDILLVDDIQFIAGKESTEEEFFHTFNTLHNANKQIVVTSDRPPKAIHSLQDRLRSRFEWGLLADIQPPEYEHRLAILRSKAESLRFAIPPSVIEYIARPECSSVRELEGALNRVIAYATLHDAPLSVSLAAQALEHMYSESEGTLDIDGCGGAGRRLPLLQRRARTHQGQATRARDRVAAPGGHVPDARGDQRLPPADRQSWWDKRPHHHYAWLGESAQRLTMIVFVVKLRHYFRRFKNVRVEPH